MSKFVKLVTLFLTLCVFSAQSFAATTLNGAGATFPEPLYTKWFADFHGINKEAQINYQGIGSGGGIRQLMSGTVDFGASDDPMKAEEEQKLSGGVLHVPTVIGAVVIVYNLDIKGRLKLTGDVIGKIFTGEITKWSDPQITALNKDLKLPDTTIAPAFRSDGSGTTAVFTSYLASQSPSFATKVGQGKTVSWTAGVGGKGNAGVSGLVQAGLGTIGYVELVYATQNKMPYALIQNKAGQFVDANLKSVTASAAKQSDAIIKAGFKTSLLNGEGKETYPLSSLTWLLIPKAMPKEKAPLMGQFLNWALSPAGQKVAADLGYAPLPTAVASAALTEVNKVIPKK